jgi:hypothetical protein
MKITKQKLLELEGIISMLARQKAPVKFSYALLRNRDIVEREAKPIRELQKPSDEIMEYEKKRKGLCEDYADKDKNDEPIVENNNYKIPDDKFEEFEEKVEELKEEYKEAIEEHEGKNEEIMKILEDKVELDFHQVSMKHLPDVISPYELDVLRVMISDFD